MIARYIGPDLAEALAPRAMDEVIRRTCHDVVRTGEDIMHRTAAAATPVRTGVVRDSWVTMPIERISGAYRGVVENDHWLAWILNYGAEAHVIKPDAKRAEAFAGGAHPVAEVHHPGVEPHYMIERALDTLEATIGWSAEHDVRGFRDAWEAAIMAESGKLR